MMIDRLRQALATRQRAHLIKIRRDAWLTLMLQVDAQETWPDREPLQCFGGVPVVVDDRLEKEFDIHEQDDDTGRP